MIQITHPREMSDEEALQIALTFVGHKVVGPTNLTKYKILMEKSGNILFIDIRLV